MVRREKKEEKVKKLLKIILIVIFSLGIISGSTYIGASTYIKYKEKSRYDKLAEFMEEEKVENTEEEEEKEPEKSERIIKLEDLHSQNEDIVAWIEIPDTNINYPVLHTDNNDFYLNHDYQKKYSARGSIFLDKDVDINLPSTNFLMYGHRNKNGTMFEDLLKFKDEEFYKNHKTIKFITLAEDIEYEILAVFYSKIYYKSDKNVFRYYYFVNADTEEEYKEFVDNAKKASIYDTGVDASFGEQLITLSTCNYHTDDRKICSSCKKTEFKKLMQQKM